MLVGHGALAFAVAGTLAATLTDRPPRQCLLLAAVAFAFGTLPDVDALFALAATAYDGVTPGTVVDFWDVVNAFHRSTTHSFFVQFSGGLVAVGVALLAPPRRWTTTLLGLTVAAVATAGATVVVARYGSPLEGVLVTVFLALVAVVAYVPTALTPLTDRLVGVAAAIGLLLHSPGDLFWIPPPDLLYPFVSPTLAGPLSFHPVPEANVALVFLGESVVVLLGVLAYLYIVSASPLDRLYPGWVFGLGILAARPHVPLPTVENPYTYSAVLLGLGLATAGVVFLRSPPDERLENAVFNAACCVWLASLAHAAAVLAGV